MKTTFNKLVGESRESLEVIDSHTLKNMIENKEDMAIIDVNDKEETDKRGMIQGAFNVSLGTLYYKADQEVPENSKI
jgi:Rhodanese-like domain.